ncbi:Hypoxic response protein 1 [Streptomyces sp. RB5]|uniref:Hypoxic response protein 1 n=1 Tax=Streptomyces smaragdinus TaxID=2585196 RepID=A0A7K0CTH2_9ACTN|nr:CBS domain-containing protein [Streptomyces smaragdinus]MQY16302.1 Hypoxic response protein 1 [Streptomyces smaragdinus]
MTAPTAEKTARDLMHSGVQCVKSTETVATAAVKMRDLDVGCMPICGPDDKLIGMLTDRDIVTECVAQGKDMTMMQAGDLAHGRPAWVKSTATKDQVLALMSEHQVRRLPVIEDGKLVGMISECDLVRGLEKDDVAKFCNAVYGV